MVEIVDDDEYEPDEQFYLKLSLNHRASFSHKEVTLGRISIMEITILNDDGNKESKKSINYRKNNFNLYSISSEPGTITFEERGILVKESVGLAQLPVLRKNGWDGEVSIHWRTIGIESNRISVSFFVFTSTK